MSRWFRHYAGMVRDDKLVRASIKSKQPIERVVWVWGAVLESAAEFDDCGQYEVEPEEIARFLRCKASAIQAVLDALSDLGRIADGRVTTWSKRQFKSDRSNERVTAHRTNKRAQGNADVTLQERCGNSPKTETETEYSVAKATALDPEKVMFDHGVEILASCGVKEARSRPLLGKWKKAHGPEAVIVALGAAKREGAPDPVAFMEGCFRQRARDLVGAYDGPLA